MLSLSETAGLATARETRIGVLLRRVEYVRIEALGKKDPTIRSTAAMPGTESSKSSEEPISLIASRRHTLNRNSTTSPSAMT